MYWSFRTQQQRPGLYTSSTTLNLLGLALAEDLLSGPLDDTSCDGEAGGSLEIEINLASRLTALVDTPEYMISNCSV